MSLEPEPPEPSLTPEVAVAADQAAAHVAATTGHHGPFHTHCENCGTKLAGPYCHRCGQHDFEFHRSFWHVFLEGLESFLHFDSKLFHTVATLIFRPGRLTAAFNAGKRNSQMPPLRLYIFVSLVFFFLFFLSSHGPDQLFNQDLNGPVDISMPATGEKSGGHEPTRATGPDKESAEPAAQAKGTIEQPDKEQDSPMEHWLRVQGQRAADPEHQREMMEKFMHTLPKMLLFCLPIFALYTRVLYRKAGLVYLQHLVLALHFHTLILLWSMLKDGWVFLAGLVGTTPVVVVTGLFNCWLLLYPFLMFRHLFGGTWMKTIIKAGLLCVGYVLTLMFAALVSGFIIFAML